MKFVTIDKGYHKTSLYSDSLSAAIREEIRQSLRDPIKNTFFHQIHFSIWMEIFTL